jgi:cell division protein FtsQ
MIFQPRRNRRRTDVAKKDGDVAAARAYGPLVLKVLLTTLATAAAAWGLHEAWGWANTSDRFALTEVVYRGLERASGSELSRLAGLTTGINLVALDVEAAERALATHPWVKSVRVLRRFPSRLEIVVEEHMPVALLALGELYLVDEDGVPFKRLSPQDGLDLPLVTGIARERFVRERDVALAELSQAVGAAMTYARSSAAARHRLSEVHVEAGEVTIVTEDGVEIRFGDGPLGDKLARLERVRAALEDRRLTAAVIRLDDRVRPSRVTVQLSTSGPEAGKGTAH